jgi:hypothetical protein
VVAKDEGLEQAIEKMEAKDNKRVVEEVAQYYK